MIIDSKGSTFSNPEWSCGLRNNQFNKIVVAVHKLPLIAQRGGASIGWTFTESEDDSTYHSFKKMSESYEVYMVGLLNVNVDYEMHASISEAIFAKYRYIPIFHSHQDYVYHAKKFSNEKLWPILHGVYPQSSNYDRFDSKKWDSFISLNLEYAEKILRLKSLERSILCIDDYNLMLLPNIIRINCPRSKIMFFLRTPFPNLEIFQCMTVREKLLMGMLGADLMGFCSSSHAFNFISSCQKIIGVGYKSREGKLQLDCDGRSIMIQIVPVLFSLTELFGSQQLGIESDLFSKLDVKTQKKKKEKVIMLGIDDLSDYSGIELKLYAMEELLKQGVSAVLLQLVVVNCSACDEERRYIEKLVRVINIQCCNDRFDPIIVKFCKQSEIEEEKLAAYRLADCLVITAVQDVAYFTPFEFVVFGKGCDMIVSENVTSTESLFGVIKVNPWDIKLLKEVMLSKINKPTKKMNSSHQRNLDYIKRHNVILHDLVQDVLNMSETYNMKSIDCFGFGLTRRKIYHDQNSGRINVAPLRSQYGDAKKRLLILDFDGLTNPLGLEEQAFSKLAVNLNRLSCDGKNNVVVLTKLSMADIPDWLAISDNVKAVIEDGFLRRSSGQHEWIKLKGHENLDYMQNVRSVFQEFQKKIPGVFLEENHSSLVMHFNGMNSQLVALLIDDMEDALAGDPAVIDGTLVIYRGKDTLKIKPKRVTKAKALKEMLTDDMKADDCRPDFAFCIGVDAPDQQELVQTVKRFSKNTSQGTNNVHQMRVGFSSEGGVPFLNDLDVLVELLQELSRE